MLEGMYYNPKKKKGKCRTVKFVKFQKGEREAQIIGEFDTSTFWFSFSYRPVKQ